MAEPLVTVLMSVYNGEEYLNEAVGSILKQTFEDFEFLIIDDASTDRTVKIIRSYNDVRIRLYQNDSNLGLTKSLNKGLKLAKGSFIARMDADDISLPIRLQRQVDFLLKNNKIGLLGTWFEILGKNQIIKTPCDPEEIKIRLLFKNPIAHPTTIFRREIIETNGLDYNESLTTSQDHELWYRLSKYTLVHNIPEVLVQYRAHEKQISKSKEGIQTQNANAIRNYKVNDFLDRKVLKEWMNALNRLLMNQTLSSKDFINLVNLLNLLKQKNRQSCVYNEKKFEAYLNVLLKRGLNSLKKINRSVMKAYFSSSVKSLRDIYNLSRQIKKIL